MEQRQRIGEPDFQVTKAKISRTGLIAEIQEIYQFSEGDPAIETVTYEKKRAPHPDLLQSFMDLEPHLAAICCIDLKKVKDFQVTGISVKNLLDEKGQGVISGKYRVVDDLWIACNTPLIKLEVTAFKNSKSLTSELIKCCDEVRLYIKTGKCENEKQWSLFDAPEAEPKAAATS